MTLSLLCLIVSGATHGVVTVALNVSAIGLCLYAMRVAWPAPRRRGSSAPDDGDD
jgi:hypothetical protein